MVSRFLEDERGATVIEYGLIIAVLSLVIVSGIGQAGNSVSWLLGNKVGTAIK